MRCAAAILIALTVTIASLLAVDPALAKGTNVQPGNAEQGEVRGDPVEAFLITLPATFQVDGLNPDGSAYTGTAQMSFNSSTQTATIVWQVGSDTFQGQGPLNEGRFVIDWGDTTPVIYTVTPDLTLSGTWAGGRASETLTPIP